MQNRAQRAADVLRDGAKSKGKMHHSHPCEHCPFLGSAATALGQWGNGNEGERHMHGRKETSKRSKQPLFELQ